MASNQVSRPRTGDLDPFAPFRTQFDRLFDDFFGAGLPAASFDFNPAIDVKESDKHIRIIADLPGVKEDDIDLSVRGDLVTIRGERKEETKEEKEDWHRVERRYGSFQRSMRLPFAPSDDAVKASFKDGVLTVKIAKPKDGAKGPKRISINKD